MAIDFGALLTTEQKRSVLEQRIANFAAEGYQHTLNRAAAESLGNDALVESSTSNIDQISAAIESDTAELAKLTD